MKKLFSLLLVPIVGVALTMSVPSAFGQDKKDDSKMEKKSKSKKSKKEKKEEAK